MAMLCLVACQNDDTDFSEYTNGSKPVSKVTTISIVYTENTVTVTGDDKGYVGLTSLSTPVLMLTRCCLY